MSSDDRKTPGDDDAGGDAPKPEPTPEPAGETGTITAATAVAAGERMDLPKWNRARVKRAPAKTEGGPAETDAFQQGVREAGRAAVRRGPLVVLGVLALAGIIGGVIWLSRRGDETKAIATRPLAEAAALRHRGRMVDLPAKPTEPPSPAEIEATVERKLAETAAADDGEKAQKLALLVRGGKLVEAADFAGAETHYREFIAKSGTGHDLSFLALEGIVIALEGQGNLEGALTEVETLVGAPGDFYRDQALWHKGRLLEALDRKDDALAVYQQYAQEFPLDQPSLAKAAVRERLAELDPSMALPEERSPGGLGELLVP